MFERSESHDFFFIRFFSQHRELVFDSRHTNTIFVKKTKRNETKKKKPIIT